MGTSAALLLLIEPFGIETLYFPPSAYNLDGF